MDSRRQDMQYQPEAQGYDDAPPAYSSQGYGADQEATLTEKQEAELIEETLRWIPRPLVVEQALAPPLRVNISLGVRAMRQHG